MDDQLTKWDFRFLRLAREVSTWSKDPSTKIGAVACKDKRILSMGYNGFPSGIEDTNDRLENKEQKYKFVVHGEMNCIYNATLNGVSLKSATMYVYGLPICNECAKGIIQVGINRVVMCFTDASQKWQTSFLTSKTMFEESGIIMQHVEKIEND